MKTTSLGLREFGGMRLWIIAAALAVVVGWAFASGGVANAQALTATPTPTATVTPAPNPTLVTGPRITRVDRMEAPSNKSYQTRDAIEVAVYFDKEVTVVGRPRIAIAIGDNTEYASYISSFDNGRWLKFGVVVMGGWYDDDGYSIAANSLELNGGTITDASNNNAILTHAALPANAFYRVNVKVPSLSHINITSYAGSDDTYYPGDTIRFSVYFTDNVTTYGSPQLEFNLGTASDKDEDRYRLASHYSTNFSEITFEYVVETGDDDGDGISIPKNPVLLNGGRITDGNGNSVTLSLAATGANGLHKVQSMDTLPPSIVRVEVVSYPSTTDGYQLGETIEVGVIFTEPVLVDSDSSVEIQIGSSAVSVPFSHTSFSGAYYKYTVQATDNDSNGLSIDADAVSHGDNANIMDASGNAAVLIHQALGDDSEHKVEGTDTTAPYITGISISSDPGDGIYGVGETVTIAVSFNEALDISGSMSLNFMLDQTQKTATFSESNRLSGSDKSLMLFEYTVQVGDFGRVVGVPANAVQLTTGSQFSDDGENDVDLTYGEVDFFPEAVNHMVMGVGGV